MNKTKAVLVAAALASLSACATTYTAENFADYQEQHETVAVLPFIVTIDRNNLEPGYDPAEIDNLEKDEAFAFQNQVQVQLLSRSERDGYTVAFQPANETNVYLSRAGVEYEDLRSYTKPELGRILGVDAVISGNLRRSQPVGNGGAVAAWFLAGALAPTNVAKVTMTVHDTESGQLVWAYDHRVEGSVGSSSEGVAKSLVRNSASKFPYKEE